MNGLFLVWSQSDRQWLCDDGLERTRNIMLAGVFSQDGAATMVSNHIVSESMKALPLAGLIYDAPKKTDEPGITFIRMMQRAHEAWSGSQ